ALLLVVSLAACTSNAPSNNNTPDNTAAAEKDHLDRIQEAGKLVVAMEGNWSPWTFHDESDKLVGYDVEVAAAIAEKLGVEIEYIEGAWEGLFMGLSNGRYDLVVNGVGITESRKETYDFSEPYAYNTTVLIARKDNEEIKSLADLEGKVTANSLGSTFESIAIEAGVDHVETVDTLEETLNLVLNGRVDATLNAKGSFDDYMRAHPDDPLYIVEEVKIEYVGIPVVKGEDNARLLEAINEVIAAKKADGSLAELSNKYFGFDMSHE
ncbi:MAG: transporter substrate-binding domain-containing protein, partial [Erysipelotrichaceae bacterium]|nr:transporter substrate-binding domain-containing protein [Erysipelotrichaceae bacterium]